MKPLTGDNLKPDILSLFRSYSLLEITDFSLIIMNKSQETTVFSSFQKLISAMKLNPEKSMIDFKFYALQVSLHREPPEVGLVEKLSRSLYWWVELGVPSQQ